MILFYVLHNTYNYIYFERLRVYLNCSERMWTNLNDSEWIWVSVSFAWTIDSQFVVFIRQESFVKLNIHKIRYSKKHHSTTTIKPLAIKTIFLLTTKRKPKETNTERHTIDERCDCEEILTVSTETMNAIVFSRKGSTKYACLRIWSYNH